MNLQEYEQFDTVLRKLNTNFMSFGSYQNAFLIDYQIEERKLAIFYLTERHLLFAYDGEMSVIHPHMEFLTKLLFHDGWTCKVVDFREFEQLGERRQEWLQQKIEELYKLTFETQKKIHFEKRLEILQHSFEEMIYLFNDKKYRDMKLFQEQIRRMRDEAVKNYREKEKTG